MQTWLSMKAGAFLPQGLWGQGVTNGMSGRPPPRRPTEGSGANEAHLGAWNRRLTASTLVLAVQSSSDRAPELEQVGGNGGGSIGGGSNGGGNGGSGDNNSDGDGSGDLLPFFWYAMFATLVLVAGLWASRKNPPPEEPPANQENGKDGNGQGKNGNNGNEEQENGSNGNGHKKKGGRIKGSDPVGPLQPPEPEPGQKHSLRLPGPAVTVPIGVALAAVLAMYVRRHQHAAGH